jgi:hypothetical protein
MKRTFTDTETRSQRVSMSARNSLIDFGGFYDADFLELCPECDNPMETDATDMCESCAAVRAEHFPTAA